MLPESLYQFCQSHYLRNLAEPLAQVDSTFNVELRKAVREQVGELIRAEKSTEASQVGLLTVTGLLPDGPQAGDPKDPCLPRDSGKENLGATDEVVSHLYATLATF